MFNIDRAWLAHLDRICKWGRVAINMLQARAHTGKDGPPSFVLWVALISAFSSVPTWGQTGRISGIPGLTPPAAAVGRAIETLCPPLATARRAGAPFSPAQNDLIDRCSELFANAPTRPALVSNALLPIAPEEAPSQGSTSVEFFKVQEANLAARLAALRRAAVGGGFRGFALNGSGTTFAEALAGLSDSSPRTARTEATSLAPRLGVFLNGSLTLGDQDATSREAGFDFDEAGLTAGLDYQLIQNLVVGAAFSYSSAEADFDSSGGDLDVDRFIGSIYGLYYLGERFYLDGLASFGGNTFDMRRNIIYTSPGLAPGTTVPVNQTAKSETDGFEYAFALGAGYDYHFGGFTIGPFLRLNYAQTNLDAFQESIDNTRPGFGWALAFESQDVDSFTTALGAQIAYPISTGWGVLLPQLRAEWGHEFLNDGRTIATRFVNDPAGTSFPVTTEDPDRDFFNLGAGLSAVFARGRSAFLYYETVLGLRDITAHNIVAGVRLTF